MSACGDARILVGLSGRAALSACRLVGLPARASKGRAACPRKQVSRTRFLGAFARGRARLSRAVSPPNDSFAQTFGNRSPKSFVRTMSMYNKEHRLVMIRLTHLRQLYCDRS